MSVEQPLKLHADLHRRAVVDTTALDWQASPAAGVERRLIERDGAEAARATSLVRYAPGSDFPTHTHPRGEEILVLEGTFGDEFGAYPAGTYLRNPPGSAHAPRTPEGCVIFVKLRHMHPDDPDRVVRATAAGWRDTRVPGLRILPLGGFGGERAALMRAAPGTTVPAHDHPGGEEVLVLEGSFEDEHGRYPRGTWLRQPHASAHAPSTSEGCLVWVKSGHLPR
jgi:anti-sigma factor ChrR (cupin superfamily)